MFKRSFTSKDRSTNKAVRASTKRSFRENAKLKSSFSSQLPHLHDGPPTGTSPTLTSPIITLVVGRDARLFACHEDVISLSPFFAAALKGTFYDGAAKKFELPDEEPEIFSSVLEYLYKGDYAPRLLHDKRRNGFLLEGSDKPRSTLDNNTSGTVFYHAPPFTAAAADSGAILKDTAIYCAAEKFGLDELKRLALRKQGLQTGIQVDVILRSARFAYAHTPDHDAKLRAHYLALIIRSRKTFKRSGTMQMEMERGGSKLFFDLFVAMCNHVDDVVEMTNAKSPGKF